MKKIPTLKTDKEAEAFLDQDLSDLDFSQFKTMRLEFAPKSAALHLRLPEALLEGLKVRAKAQGVPYTRYVRMLLENDLAKSHSSDLVKPLADLLRNQNIHIAAVMGLPARSRAKQRQTAHAKLACKLWLVRGQ